MSERTAPPPATPSPTPAVPYVPGLDGVPAAKSSICFIDGDQGILGLHVAVDDAGAVRRAQAAGELAQDVELRGERHTLAHPLANRREGSTA